MIRDFTREDLRKAFLRVTKQSWQEQADIIREASRALGFQRCGPQIQKALKSAISGLIRMGRLERDRTRLRKVKKR